MGYSPHADYQHLIQLLHLQLLGCLGDLALPLDDVPQRRLVPLVVVGPLPFGIHPQVLRIPKPGAPTPVRGRTPETLWGLPHLDQAAQTQLDDDSILILRQMYITSLARASRAAVSLPGPRSFLEHPEDPVVSSSLPKAKECSSFWITEGSFGWRRTP